MSIVTIEVASRAKTDARFIAAAETGQPQGAYITFPTVTALWSTLTAKRWELMQALCGAGPVSVREAARRVGRDVKRVHEDVHALLQAGILERADDGRIVLPYDELHVDFRLQPQTLAA